VKITWFDRKRSLKELRKAVHKLAEEHPEIEAVILFGSLATGEAVPGSDADLLLVLDRSDQHFLSRIPRYVPSRCKIDVDVFPYTEDEIEKMLAAGNPFIKEALEHGVELFKRKSLNIKGTERRAR